MAFDDPGNKLQKTCLTFCSDIEAIFADLFKLLNVHSFSFHRVYKNEERLFMSNSTKWVENYFENNYFSAHLYKNKFNLSPYILWAEWPENDVESHKIIKDAYNNFNSGNALAIIRYKDEYLDIFSIRGFARDHDVNSRYLRSLDIINAYLDYFLIVYQKSIAKAANNKIILNDEMDDTFTKQTSDSLVHGSNILIYNTILHPDTGKPFLGKREIECLQQLVRGKSAKEIARTLSISPRTVEQHLKNIKDKMHVNSKRSLLDKLLSLDNNKRILIGLR